MKILLVGSGGREHALGLKLKAREGPVELYSAPGSDALAELGTCLPFAAEDVDGLARWCAEARPDLVVIGPEGPLVAGLADAIRDKGIAVFGHGRATARLEGSKAYAKDFMVRHGIPCAASHEVQDLAEGEAIIRGWPHPYPVVLKADGLAAGKGVVLAESEEEALETLRAFLGGRFGSASRTVVLEEPLVGMELSLHVLVDVDAGHASFLMLPPCQDHKRLGEGDQGPNTGGMGAFAPIPFLRLEDLGRLRRELVEPTIRGCQEEGLVARGVFFLGVMWTASGPKLLEYNVRFGDPETQVLVELLDEDLAALLKEVADGHLEREHLAFRPGCALSVVLAAEGYPEAPVKGVPIALGEAPVRVIHAGTRRDAGAWLTHGGRVLNLVAHGSDLASARAAIEEALPQADWPGRQVRRDIGLRALRHAEAQRTVADAW